MDGYAFFGGSPVAGDTGPGDKDGGAGGNTGRGGMVQGQPMFFPPYAMLPYGMVPQSGAMPYSCGRSPWPGTRTRPAAGPGGQGGQGGGRGGKGSNHQQQEQGQPMGGYPMGGMPAHMVPLDIPKVNRMALREPPEGKAGVVQEAGVVAKLARGKDSLPGDRARRAPKVAASSDSSSRPRLQNNWLRCRWVALEACSTCQCQTLLPSPPWVVLSP